MQVGFGNVSNRDGLTQLRLIVPIINARQHITSFDVLPSSMGSSTICPRIFVPIVMYLWRVTI